MRNARLSDSKGGGGIYPTPKPLDADPPPPTMNKMTHVSKNVTLLQTSFEGGKNKRMVKSSSANSSENSISPPICKWRIFTARQWSFG